MAATFERPAPRILLPFLLLLSISVLAVVQVIVLANITDVGILLTVSYIMSFFLSTAALVVTVWLIVNVIRRLARVSRSERVRKALKTAQEFRK